METKTKNIFIRISIYSIIFIFQYAIICFIFWDFVNPFNIFFRLGEMDSFLRTISLFTFILYAIFVVHFAEFFYRTFKI